MNARQLKEKYIKFFESNGHIEIPTSSLVPDNDPTTLFITAGMHPLVPYLLGQTHPSGNRLVDVQKCVRTGDIDEVGDTTHHTFFEMLGNWSLNDYFKKEAITLSFNFLTKELGVNPLHLHATCFGGNENVTEKDQFSYDVWKSLGLDENQIHFLSGNWWGPASVTGPCGPDSEMFLDTIPELPMVDFETGDASKRYVEIWNDVFMQYNKNSEGKFIEMVNKNVDTGMGVERTTAIISGFSDNYMSSIWQPIIKKIEELSNKKYEDILVKGGGSNEIGDGGFVKYFRIIADHLRSAVFIIADGVEPSNKERGYVLRRLIRRAIRQGKLIGIENNFTKIIAQAVIDNQDNYAGIYPELNDNSDRILSVLDAEEVKFRKTLNNGIREIEKFYMQFIKNTDSNLSKKVIDEKFLGEKAFYFYESFGFPVEMFLDENIGALDSIIKILNREKIIEEFNQAKESHQNLSRTLSSGKFKSGLADNSEIITKYHTATHLLHTSLRKILGNHVQQSGSNITSERLRFDFSHTDKLTDDQLKEVEAMVNNQIDKSLPVTIQTLKYTDAINTGALAFFGNKYPETVSVYTVGEGDNLFSKEVCTGPHVENTGTIGHISIFKEESAGSGKRRIYAKLV